MFTNSITVALQKLIASHHPYTLLSRACLVRRILASYAGDLG